jgi:hypothetical protein
MCASNDYDMTKDGEKTLYEHKAQEANLLRVEADERVDDVPAACRRLLPEVGIRAANAHNLYWGVL